MSTVKYSDFIQKGKASDISIVSAGTFIRDKTGNSRDELTDGLGPEGGNVLAPFGEHWLQAFKETNAYAVWDSVTDPVLFDLCEPRYATPPAQLTAVETDIVVIHVMAK